MAVPATSAWRKKECDHMWARPTMGSSVAITTRVPPPAAAAPVPADAHDRRRPTSPTARPGRLSHQVGGEGHAGDPEPDRVRREVRHGQTQPGDGQGQDHGQRQARGRPGGAAPGGGGGQDQQGEHQQRPGDLAGLGRGHTQQHQEHHRQGLHGHAPALRHLGVDGWRTAAAGRWRPSTTRATAASHGQHHHLASG